MKSNKINLAIAIALGLGFSGCARNHYANLTIDTFPKGGQIIDLDTNKKIGVSYASGRPYLGTTDGDNQPNQLCKTFKGVNVKWVSGAVKKIENIKLCTNDNRVITVDRPTDAKNLQADLDYARDLEYRALEERKIAAMNSQAAAARSNARANRNQAYQLQRVNSYIRYGY